MGGILSTALQIGGAAAGLASGGTLTAALQGFQLGGGVGGLLGGGGSSKAQSVAAPVNPQATAEAEAQKKATALNEGRISPGAALSDEEDVNKVLKKRKTVLGG